MEKILCATRGGEASYRTQDAAIALSKEEGATLVFIYVVDISFINKTAHAVRPDVVSAEIEKMGEFLLAIAQERAQKQGVSAEVVLHHGDFREELMNCAKILEIDLILLGKPIGEESVFELEKIEAFASELETETGIEVRIVG
jgi:nucleotide-binding universal stress UspA family protein